MNIAIIQDLVDEVNESFTFHLRRTVDLSTRIELDPVDGVIEVADGKKYTVPYLKVSPINLGVFYRFLRIIRETIVGKY